MLYFLFTISLLVIAVPVIRLVRAKPPAPVINTTGVCHCTRCGQHFHTPADLIAHRVWTLRGRFLRLHPAVRCMTSGELYANFTSALFGKLGQLVWRAR